MRICVTGCSGYIGEYLINRLKTEGYYILGIDREPLRNAAVDRFIQCDLLETDRYRKFLLNVDVLCHLAAAKGDWGISKQEYYRDNLQATETLLEAAKQSQIKKWFFYSTVSVLGPSKIPLAEESPRRPINAYGASKTECEELFEQYFAQEPGVNIVIVRPSVVFGPGNPWNTNIFRLIDTIYRRRFIMIGNGEDVKTTSYIENLIEAHMFLMHRQMNNNQSGVEIFHYVDEPQEKTHEIIEAIYQNLDRKYSRLRLPLWFASPIARISDVLASILNIDFPITSARIEKFCTPTNFSSQAIRKLGFVQKVSNDQAIKETIDSYIREHSV